MTYRRSLSYLCSSVFICGSILLSSSGCTFLACSGDGPLKREELGNWAKLAPWPEPEARDLRRRTARLRQIPVPSYRPFAGEYGYREGPRGLSRLAPGPCSVPLTPAPGYAVRGTSSLWLRLAPSLRLGEWLYSPLEEGPAEVAPAREGIGTNPPAGAQPAGGAAAQKREFYAGEQARGFGFLLGDFLFWSARAEVFQTDDIERVAAEQVEVAWGWGLGATRVRRIVPVDADGRPGLHALADPKKDIYDVRYLYQDGRSLLFGMIGWGRVNRRHYLQLFWIPIRLGQAGE
jgi:hypothetical protein